jgi:hypothetical protein
MPVCVIAMPAATPAFAAHMLILPGDEIALVGDQKRTPKIGPRVNVQSAGGAG